MAFPLGANANIYNMLLARTPETPVTVEEYNAAVDWILASDPSTASQPGMHHFTAGGGTTPAYTPPAGGGATTPPTGYNPESGWSYNTGTGQWEYLGLGLPVGTTGAAGGGTTGGGLAVTGPGGAGTSDVFNQFLAEMQYNLEQTRIQEEAAGSRAQLAANTQLAAAQAAAAAQLQAQQEADRAALERLRYQLGKDLASALMANDQNMFQRTMDTAELAADPRSIVGFLEYTAQAGGGPTALSQNLAAGLTPSPVWEYMPAATEMSPEIQQLIDLLQDFVGGGTLAGAAGPGATPGGGYTPATYGRARVGTTGGTKTW